MEWLKGTDIYLIDQLLKGTYDHCKDVLDVGCGTGRNLRFLASKGAIVSGIDRNAETVLLAEKTIREIPEARLGSFLCTEADQLPFESESFDLVICNALLHFSASENHFMKILKECFRVLRPGGYFFARTASDIGIEPLVRKTEGERTFILPDGSTRFLVNLEFLLKAELEVNAISHEPIKTTNVQNTRCMTTWCLIKT
ncbi:MAG: hypothetical protein RL226_1464 [Bacteroidota bacterium]|jgi:ubiquinone/menaquinone biosynthesis C-methylase UbiE